MKAIPTDPVALQARVVAALCDDLFDIGAGRSHGFARTDAIRQVLVERNAAEPSDSKPEGLL